MSAIPAATASSKRASYAASSRSSAILRASYANTRSNQIDNDSLLGEGSYCPATAPPRPPLAENSESNEPDEPQDPGPQGLGTEEERPIHEREERRRYYVPDLVATQHETVGNEVRAAAVAVMRQHREEVNKDNDRARCRREEHKEARDTWYRIDDR